MKIYINVTETVLNKLRTGIQRVVREVITHSEVVAEKLSIEVIPVVIHGKNFYRLDNLEPLLNLEAPENTNSTSYSTSAKSIILRLAKYTLKRIPAAYLMAIKLITWIRFRSNIVTLYSDKNYIKMTQGDVVLLLDSFWSSFNLTLNAAKKSRKHGATVITVIYDVIPLTYSQYCDNVHVSRFSSAFSNILAISDGIMTISKSVLDDVKFLTVNKYQHLQSTLCFDYFYLGADFAKTETLDANSYSWPEGLWAEEHVFLMVGTIEPRKGHAFVIDVFEQRWQAGKTDKLLILGKVGWKTEALIERIVNSTNFGSNLFMLNQVSDTTLNEAYQRAYACVQASYVEGFGLPLIETLQHGTPLIASDIPVFKEIVGSDADFFTLGDITSFNNAVESLQKNYAATKIKLEKYKWLTWEEATEQLLSNVKQMALRI